MDKFNKCCYFCRKRTYILCKRGGTQLKIAVLIGNGLSVALTKNLSLTEISSKFLKRLNGVSLEARALVERHISDTRDKSDFEKCIAGVEKYYDSLHDIERRRNIGVDNSSDWEKEERSLLEAIYLFSALIVEIVNGNVKLRQIESQLKGFVKWLTSIIEEQDQVDLFTLNYDLLLETILLQTLGQGAFMEFYRHAGEWKEIRAPHLYFNPPHALRKWKDCRVRLYHLHGSISSFKNLNKEAKYLNKKKDEYKGGTIFKITTEAIRENNFYQKIFDLNIVPSIITGGKKSEKIKELPFRFYYDEFIKILSNNDRLCDKLFIIGYSFRDDHINKALSERIKLSHPIELVIVDYASSDEAKEDFVERVNSALGLTEGMNGRLVVNDSRILFGGANSIEETIKK